MIESTSLVSRSSGVAFQSAMVRGEHLNERQQRMDPNMDTDQLCNGLLDQVPDVVLQWLFEVWEGTRQAPNGFNWVGLAEVSADLANESLRRERGSSPPDLGWAHVAVHVNSFLLHEMRVRGRSYCSARIVPPEFRELAGRSFEWRVMNLRVGFLLRLGSIPGDPVLDRELLVQSFFQELALSPEEALNQCAAGRQALSRQQSRKLSRIRENLDCLRPLAERHLLPQELLPWYSIREQLSLS
jgi:hypothetical protein